MYRYDKEKIFAKILDGEAVLVNIDTGAYFTLNEVGSVIWSCLEKGEDFDAIVGRVTNEYLVSAEDARRDVQEFLQQLQTQGLISAAE